MNITIKLGQTTLLVYEPLSKDFKETAGYGFRWDSYEGTPHQDSSSTHKTREAQEWYKSYVLDCLRT